MITIDNIRVFDLFKDSRPYRCMAFLVLFVEFRTEVDDLPYPAWF
jgi:hypothetical protein